MLSKAKEKLIRSLLTKKGREKSGLCLVEGRKVIELAGEAVEFTFERADTELFDQLVSTETPQSVAGVAKIPVWSKEDIFSRKTVVVLDGVQDPGNVGAIFRLCLGFNASLVLVESADSTNPKVVRSSVGALFKVPWMKMQPDEAEALLEEVDRDIYRLEIRAGSQGIALLDTKKPAMLIAGSEGNGIRLKTPGTSIHIEHEPELESLNVGHAVAIALYLRR